MIKATGFSHAALRISNVERARSFYENVLGLQTLPRPDFGFGGAWYGVGENQIHLISSEKRHDGIDPLGPHVALTVEDFDATKAALKEQGIQFLEAPGNMLGRQLWVLDPDGNTVELRSEK
jgi:catechol 2,3-dioxygenase-like lactoylglutathione lyase family enzyme